MRAILYRGPAMVLLAGLMVLAAGSSGQGQPAPTEPPGASSQGTARGKSPPLPPGSIVAVYDNLVDAFKNLPRAVILTPEKYKALLDEIDRLKKQLERPAIRTPSRVVLKGKVEGTIAQVTAQFEFETETPNELVRLGCGLGQATGVSLDGRTPRLRSNQPRGRGATEGEGFVVELDEPGDHQLTLDLVIPVTTGVAGQELALDLPRAAITTLELDLPAGSRDLRVGGKPVADTLLTFRNNQVTGGLGAVGRLDLAWRSAATAATSAVLAAEGQVVSRLERRDKTAELTTEARLTLRVLSGQTKQWRLLVPLRSEIKPATPADEARLERIEVSDQKQLSLRTLHLREASSDPLNVIVTHTQPAPSPGQPRPVSVGPFTALGAVKQDGTLLVCSSIADWHLEFTPQADLTRRGPTEEELRREPNLTAAFRFGPGSGARDGRGSLSWLDLEAETVRGQIKTRSTHSITLGQEGPEGPRWQVQTSVVVTPRWADVDRVVIQMPPDCTWNEEGSYPLPDQVRAVTADPAGRLVEFRLARSSGDKTLSSFAVKVEGVYTSRVDPKTPGKIALALPRPVGTVEQDGQIGVQAPSTLELLIPEGAPTLELTRQTTHALGWRYPRRPPDRLEFAWQPYRPPVQVSSLVDLTLLPGEARVRQELRYQVPEMQGQGPVRLTLSVPPAIASRVQLREGGRMQGAVPGQLAVTPSDPSQPVLVLEYSTPLVAKNPGEDVLVPLVVPEQTTRGESRCRIWSDTGLLPTSARGWSEQNIEVVPGRNRLPVLVARADRADQPLVLVLSQTDLALPALFERCLARVDVAANGVQAYRVSYLVTRVAARTLEMELPAPPSMIGLIIKLDDRQLTPELVVGERSDLRGRLVRLRVAPDLVQKSTLLEVSYRLDPSRLQGTILTTPLHLPRFGGDAMGLPTRWQITMPPGQVVLAPEMAPGTPIRWGWRGWLPAPRPAITASELERWIDDEPNGSRRASDLPLSLVLWHDNPAAVQLTHVPQQAWLLTCSMGLVLLGLLLWRLSAAGENTSSGAWLVILTLLLGLLVVVLLRPGLASQVAYGSLPGLVVLLVLGGVQWFLHERYRRQIVFLPSFTRTRTDSSLVRGEPQRPPHGEPSTVDVPRNVGSSLDRTL
ncbi:MAG: hypothetical protein U0840_16845 [Gemmataceae bacterium]